jgi:predicted metal-dependent phosphoesterase TrpH
MRVLKLRALALIGLALVSAPVVAAQAKPDQIIVLEGRCEARDATNTGRRMHLLPFNVPEGVTRIEIKKQLDYGPKGSGNVDHGLADPRGAGFGIPGFRGWMGGSKADITLTGDPGTTSQYYLAGSIQPGRWTLLQWTVRLPADGVKYRYTVRLSFDGPMPPDRMPDVAKCDQGVINPKAGWYIGDLHTHTLHSDGNKTLSQLAQQHVDAGFDFFAVTDHNTNRAHYDSAEAVPDHPKELILYGEEVTHPLMHANVIGCRPGSWFDMRIAPNEHHLPEVIARAHQDGAFFSVNHPFSWGNKDWRIPPEEWKDGDGVEVWNGGWRAASQTALDHWDALLQTGRHLVAVSGSDTHGGGVTRSPAVHVYAQNLSRDAIMDGLRKGHVFISENSKGPGLYLSVSGKSALPGDTICWPAGDPLPVGVRIIGGSGMTLRLVWPGGEMKLPVERQMVAIRRDIALSSSQSANYIRAELIKPDGKMAALTNPIYVSGQP